MPLYWKAIYVSEDWELSSFPEGLQENLQKSLIHQVHQKCQGLLSGAYSQHWLTRKTLGHCVVEVGRLNERNRVVFYSGHVNGEAVLFLLWIFIDHDYAVATKQITPRYAALTRGDHSRYVRYAPVVFDDLKEAAPPEAMGESATCFYRGHLVRLDDQQLEAVCANDQPGPLVISGPPGAGKTLLALKFMTAMRADARGLYVTRSAALVRVIQAECQAQGIEGVSCVTEASLLEVLSHGKPLADAPDCLAFIEERLTPELRAQGLTGVGLYQEFLLQSDLLNTHGDAYLSSGERQSYFPTHKVWIKQCYEGYQKYLQEKQMIHEALSSIQLEEPYDFVFVDEAQDFSSERLMSFYRCSHEGRVRYFMDSHQNLTGISLLRPHLLQQLMLTTGTGVIRHVVLKATHRLSQAGLEVFNGVLQVKLQVLKGVADQAEYSQLQQGEAAHPGEIRYVDAQTTIPPAFGGSAEFAVVVFSQEAKIRMKAYFNTSLVFFVHEIKGLEFDTILIVEPFADERCLEVARRMKELNITKTAAPGVFHRSVEKGQAVEQLKEVAGWFNALLVGISRSRQGLFFLQPPLLTQAAHHLKALMAILVPIFQPQAETTLSEPQAESLSREAWLRQASRLKEAGCIEQAKEIYFRLGFEREKIETLFPQPHQATTKKRQPIGMPTLKPCDLKAASAASPTSTVSQGSQGETPSMMKKGDRKRVSPPPGQASVESKQSPPLAVAVKHLKKDLEVLKSLENTAPVRQAFEKLLKHPLASELLCRYLIDGEVSLMDRWMINGGFKVFLQFVQSLILIPRLFELCTTEILHQPLKKKGPHKGKTIFYCLVTEDPAFLWHHWDFFKDHLTVEGMNQKVSGHGIDEGKTPWWHLAENVNAATYWQTVRPYLTAEGMNQVPVSDERKRSPLFRFLSSGQNIEFFCNNLSDFQAFLTRKGFSEQFVRGPDRVEQRSRRESEYWNDTDFDETPLALLLLNNTGCEVFLKNVTFFKPYVSETGMKSGLARIGWLRFCDGEERCRLLYQQWKSIWRGLFDPTMITHEFIVNGRKESAFIRLLKTKSGIQLFSEYWEDVKACFTVTVMNNRMQLENNCRCTPWFYLVFNKNTHAFVKKCWPDLKKLLTPETFTSTVRTENSSLSGKRVWDVLIPSTQDETSLLAFMWNDIEPYFTQLDIEHAQSESRPFWTCFFGFAAGCQYLARHWLAIKQYHTEEGLHRIIQDLPTAEWIPLLLHAEGLTLLSQCWDDFKGLCTENTLHSTTSDGVMVWEVLFGQQAGLKFLDQHWEDCQRFLTHKRLHQPIKGISLWEKLTRTKAFTWFVIAHESEFKARTTLEQWNALQMQLNQPTVDALQFFQPATATPPPSLQQLASYQN